MRIVSYTDGAGAAVGIVEGDEVRHAGLDVWAPNPTDETRPLAEVKLLAPVPRPGKIICIGLNYRDHAAESGMPVPETPVVFAKFGNTVSGPGDPILIPPITSEVDYEAELAIVIGSQARAVGVDEAAQHILGYTCVNDVSARDIQLGDGQWVRGKSLDTFCPMGPWIVTPDELGDPTGLPIRCVVNGEVLQDSSTAQMVFGPAELVSFLSQGITLEPGDVIATGTPPGVGFARKPPVYLRPGDTVSVQIDGIGELTNPVEAR
ncbi:MAG TPA: fumarylacetoacetate hydrolase family protein [Actinomycetota bacterium]|nr:fumarylacetoacetate hydrolase family protein [Actinomycetota bacterium]